MPTPTFYRLKKTAILFALLLSGAPFGGIGLGLNAADELPPELDSLLQVWSDDLRPIEDRFSTFDRMYSQFFEQYPAAMLRELEELRLKAEEFDRPFILYEAFIRKGGLLAYQGKNTEALRAYDEAERVAESLGDELRLGTVASNRGNSYAMSGQYLKATEQFTLALDHFRLVDSSEVPRMSEVTRSQQNVRMALGNVFVYIDDYDLGKSYYDAVWAELDAKNDERFRGLLAMNRAWCEHKLGNLERSAELYDLSLELFEEVNSGFYLAAAYANLAHLQMDLEKYSEAEKSARQGLLLHRKLGSTKDAIECQLLIATVESKTDAKSALRMAESMQDELLLVADNKMKSDFYELLYQTNRQLGNLEAALEMHEIYQVFSDSVQVLKNRNLVLRKAYEREVEYKLQTVEMKGRQERSELRIQQLQTVLWMILGFIVVVSFLVAVYLHERKKNLVRREELLAQIEGLRASQRQQLLVNEQSFEFDRSQLESSIGRALNDTDWKVLSILLNDPSITNAQIAEKAFKSVDGIGSSLRRMYGYFEVKETKYKKIALLHTAMRLSENKDHSKT